ncbi:MAG: universal stress protein [Chloroflexi bacterium]|nr:universal stress protein [Chloroflexota bacterium]
MLNTILLPHDGSALAERAVPFAATLARAPGSKIVLFRAVPPFSLEPTPEQDLALLADRLRDSYPDARLEVEPVLDYASPDSVADCLLDNAREHRVGLIIMSTHGRGGLGRWLYGSIADQVLRQSSVPLLLVSPTTSHPWPEDRPLRVLVPLDGSMLAESALAAAVSLASLAKLELYLLRVVEIATPALARVRSSVDAERELGNAKTYLDGTAQRLRTAGFACKVEARQGYAATTIDIVAREHGADVIAMATHGRSGLARLVLGSVATRMIHSASVPLLLIRPVDAAPEELTAGARSGPRLAPARLALTLTREELSLLMRGLDEIIETSDDDPRASSLARRLRVRLERGLLANAPGGVDLSESIHAS